MPVILALKRWWQKQDLRANLGYMRPCLNTLSPEKSVTSWHSASSSHAAYQHLIRISSHVNQNGIAE